MPIGSNELLLIMTGCVVVMGVVCGVLAKIGFTCFQELKGTHGSILNIDLKTSEIDLKTSATHVIMNSRFDEVREEVRTLNREVRFLNETIRTLEAELRTLQGANAALRSQLGAVPPLGPTRSRLEEEDDDGPTPAPSW